MAKINFTKEEVPFTQISNEVVYSNKISLKAKGMFAYLHAKPDGWDFSHYRISQEIKEGEKAVSSALKELEEFGLLKRTRETTGRMKYSLTAIMDLGEKKPHCQNVIETKRHGDKIGTVRKKENKKEREEEKKNSDESQIPLIIDLFVKNKLSASAKTWFGNKTQRKACKDLLEEFNFEDIEKIVTKVLPETNQRPRYEFPYVDSPFLLREHWYKLANGFKAKEATKKNYEII